MNKQLSFEAKEKMIALAGACFWYWNGFHNFLASAGVPAGLVDRYPRGAFSKYQTMRNILRDLEQANDIDTINNLASNFYRLKGPLDRDNLDVRAAVSKLKEFRELLGNDPIEMEIERQASETRRENRKQAVEQLQQRQSRLEDLNKRFADLTELSGITPQKRGFALERLFFDLLVHCEFECHPSYRNASGEQVDGHFSYEGFDYLVEAKWTKEVAKQPDLSVFDIKIRGKAQSTRGFFLSSTGFDQKAITKFSGDAPRIVLMTGEDLALVLNGLITFDDAMKAKVDAIVRHGAILLPLREVTR